MGFDQNIANQTKSGNIGIAQPRDRVAPPNEMELERLRTNAIDLLRDYSRPESAARLQPVLDRLQWMCRRDTGGPSQAADASRPAGTGAAADEAVMQPLSRVVRDHIVRVYRAMGCNKTRTARVLEIDVKTLYNKLKRYGIR